MLKSSKIYVAGHTGLVGSSIKNKLEENGYENLIFEDYLQLDLKNQNLTEEYFHQNKPEYVFLAAAKVGGIVANNTYKAEFIYDNLMIAANVIHASFKSGVTKLLNLGSSCIYPKFAEQPIKEEYLLTGLLEPTNEPYAIAKIAAIKLCRYYNEQYGTNYISLMPTNLYGKQDNFNLETSHVLPGIIRKMMIAKSINEGNDKFLLNDAAKNKIGFGKDNKFDGTVDSLIKIYSELGISSSELKIWGSGNVLREFLHVEDLADASVYLMNNFDYNEIGEIINIGSGKEISIRNLAFLVRDIVRYKGELMFDLSKPDGTPRKFLDSSRIYNLGWKPNIDLTDGIKNIIENYG